MTPLTPYAARYDEPSRPFRALALVIAGVLCMGALFVSVRNSGGTVAPAWHGSVVVTANCSGVHGSVSDVYSPQTVTVTWVPAKDMPGQPGQTITLTAHFTWSDSDETDSDSASATIPSNCGTPSTPPTTEVPPSTTTITPTTSSTAPPSSTSPETVPDTSVPPASTTTLTSAAPTTTSPPTPQPPTTPPDNRPYCDRFPERCPDGLPDGEGETG